MKYRFYGDELQLVRYEINVERDYFIDNDSRTYTAVSEQEKDKILERYPEAEVVEIDNSGYEWLDGMIFTQEQLKAGELEKAIEMGEAEYKQQKEESDPEYRIKVLEDALMELAAMVSEVSENG